MALLVSGSQGVQAQDIINVPDLLQVNGNPNINIRAFIADDLVDNSADLPVPFAGATAVAVIEGPLAGDPVFVSQTHTTTNGANVFNLSLQGFFASATALSGPALAPDFAVSEASAFAEIDSSVVQNNTNTGGGNLPVLFGGQVVDQDNINGLLFVSLAEATSNTATVTSVGDVDALLNGASAVSDASAESYVDSNVSQTNSNSGAGTGVLILQGQIVVQENWNVELVFADADATSGDVLLQRDGKTVAGLDGATASSTAFANTEVESEVEQTNESVLTGVATAGPIVPAGPIFAPFLTQGQIVGQLNVNGQFAFADSDATSGNVTVEHYGDTWAGNDGTAAHSVATANTELEQEVEQDNESELDGEAADGTVLQAQIVGQLNANGQFAIGAAEAYSGNVSVYRDGDTFADTDGDGFGDGIDAATEARATVEVEQEAEQENENRLDGDATVVAQGQLVGQLNLNAQVGVAAAEANGVEDDTLPPSVTVESYGDIYAAEDGIRATATAVAVAELEQEVEQDNESVNDADIGGVREGLPGFSLAPPGFPFAGTINGLQALGLLLPDGTAIQLDLVGQANASLQLGLSVANAYSGDVNVSHYGDINALNGIVAETHAVAVAELEQEAEQENENEVFAGGGSFDTELDATLAMDGTSIAGQGQLALQLNLNLQGGAAFANATAGNVTVYHGDAGIYAGADGIVAESRAVAVAEVEQEAEQENENEVLASLNGGGAGVVQSGGASQSASIDQDLLQVGVQLQLVGQLNLNGQLGIADADAISGSVYVDQAGTTSAGEDGIVAESEAVAVAELEQDVEQENENELEINGEGPQGSINQSTDGGDGQSQSASIDQEVDQVGIQGQLALQLNLNLQAGAAVANASAGNVTVYQAGALDAGLDGVVASSQAVAVAELEQEAEQENENEAEISLEGPSATSSQTETGTGAGQSQSGSIDQDVEQFGLQIQLAGQANASLQAGAAFADATSGDVYVQQYGDLIAGENGIVAESEAVAVAELDQEVEQENENELELDATGGSAAIDQSQDGDSGQSQSASIDQDLAQIGLQGQLALQLNVNGQIGVAAASAESGDVYVDQVGNLTAGAGGVTGNGITATSRAVAIAELEQESEQENENEAELSLTGPSATINPTQTGGDGQSQSTSINQGVEDDFDQIALQIQLAGQANVNVQAGLAASSASSGAVTVYSEAPAPIDPFDGIVAESSAVAVAELEQETEQENENEADISLEGQAGEINQQQTGTGAAAQSASIDQELEQGALQVQLAGQLNVNLQLGASLAEATSGSVYVEQDGTLTAEEDGIVAESSAVAIAELEQEAEQENENEAEIFAEGPSASITQNADITPDAEGEDSGQAATNDQDVEQIGLQGQLALQLNLNGQLGIAAAGAQSGDVYVDQSGTLTAGTGGVTGDGITAESSAVAVAELEQEVEQENENEGELALAGPSSTITQQQPTTGGEQAATSDPDLEQLGLQIQLAGQLNASAQLGLAASSATSGAVTVYSDTPEIDPFNGIVAESSAVAIAELEQEAEQENENEGEVGVIGSATTIDQQGPAEPAEGAEQAQAATIDSISEQLGAQIQLAGQANLNLQAGAALAESASGNVFVEQTGPLGAIEDGVVAQSTAVAVARLEQEAEQENESEGELVVEGPEDSITQNTGGDAAQAGTISQEAIEDPALLIGLQGQLALQINANAQLGLAGASALSDDVTVNQWGNLTVGENGIVAESSAVAIAELEQEVEQENEIEGNLALAGPEASILQTATGAAAQAATIDQDLLEIGLALQVGLQANLNLQAGLAVAAAESGDVYVDQSGKLTSGLDGITASSTAVAVAELEQEADQENETEGELPLEGPVANTSQEGGEGSDQVATIDQDTLALALQGQLAAQVNANLQLGAAAAIASSGDVTVYNYGDVYGGEDGIVAESRAVAVAEVEQDADQENEAELESESALGALQIQLGLQANLNLQAGLAASSATSGDVYVDQNGNLHAGKGGVTGDGITAESAAVAVAELEQEAEQENEASVETELENTAPIDIGSVEGADLILEAAAIQAQLVGQINLNAQLGLAIADATSGNVEVTSLNDPSLGDGTTAVSSATAVAELEQEVEQENEISASIELPELSEETGTNGLVVFPLEVAAQLSGALQVNASLQAGAALAFADSGDVTVGQDGVLIAGEDGVTARSEATAVAELEQEAEQENENEQEIFRDPGDGEEPATGDQPATIAAQIQLALQANANLQLGLAAADADSGDVSVVSPGKIKAGEDAIVAESHAVAVAEVDQEAEQENETEAEAEGALVLQGQAVGQLNLNIQAGAAIANADSGDVTVDQGGLVYAGQGGVTGDGLTAESRAVAIAEVEQEAEQENEVEAGASLVSPDETIIIAIGDIVDPSWLDDVGLQGQLVGQVNLNAQLGAALANATSGDVDVTSNNDPSLGDGITAESEAVAVAEVDQEAEQENEVEAEIEFPTILPVRPGDLDRLQIAAQFEDVFQANLSLQAAGAIANASSGEVKVKKTGPLEAGEDGITAVSSAAAIAEIEQEVEQENEDEKEIEIGDDVQPEDLTVAFQGAENEQFNVNTQAGAAFANAYSGEVEVNSEGTTTVGGDGITAISEAFAQAEIEQEVEQENEIELEATGTLIVQLQEFDQINFNEQIAFADADAYSEEVEVYQTGRQTAGGAGIVAASEAVALANVDQEAEQENENEASPNTGLQGQFGIQVNVSDQVGFADANAYAEDVKVVINDDPSKDDGVEATSKAVAVAEVKQEVEQENENEGGSLEQNVVQSNQSEQIADVPLLEPEFQVTTGTAPVTETETDPVTEGAPQTTAQPETPAEGDVPTDTAALSTPTSPVESGGAPVSLLPETTTDSTAPLDQAASASGGTVALAPIGDGNGDSLESFAGASADAFAGDVRVEKVGSLTADGDGIDAESTATAVARIEQEAEQENENSQDFAFADPDEDIDPIDGILQSQGPAPIDVLLLDPDAGAEALLLLPPIPLPLAQQANDAFQVASAGAFAASGDVTVWNTGGISAGEDGISAQSTAVAIAEIEQEVEQENENSQSATITAGIIGLPVPPPVEPDPADPGLEQVIFPFVDPAFQTQISMQFNFNDQLGNAFATAFSGPVDVNNDGDISAGGDGINADSTAVARAELEQEADEQENENSQTLVINADEIVLPFVQSQGVSQANDSFQNGFASASAESEEVHVGTAGAISAAGDGINAESTAVAIASVEQEVEQENENEQSAALTAGIIDTQQSQYVDQNNFSDQEATAFATAFSEKVEVNSQSDISAGGDGIKAESEAIAVAEVEQEAEQENENEQAETALGVSQSQDVGQVNEAEQSALAVAVAFAEEVDVIQNFDPNAGGDGIDASSTAVAIATVDQSIEQSNENSGAGGFVSQNNDAFQEGFAFALAVADDVNVTAIGPISAGEDGIRAVSSASARAEVTQFVEQTNSDPSQEFNNFYENSAQTAAIALASDVYISFRGNISAGDDGLVGISSADATAIGGTFLPPVLEGDAALVAPLPGESPLAAYPEAQEWLNSPELGLPYGYIPSALAVAVAQDVEILTSGDIYAGDTGIVAISVANASAESAEGGPVFGSAAVAISGDVNVNVNGDVRSRGTGIFAASFANAEGDFTYTDQGNVTVAVKSGKVEGGIDAFGIVVQGGDDNLIEIGRRGTVTSRSRWAIAGGAEDETVLNYGLVDGEVLLDGGVNSFYNYGTFYSGWNIDLGEFGFLLNDGLLNPGGSFRIVHSALTGDFEQTARGVYGVDVDMGNANSDQLNVSGTADVNGKVQPLIVANAFSGEQSVTILTAEEGVFDHGLSVKDTAVVDYGLQVNPNDVVLNMDVDFAPKGLGNVSGVGNHLNKVYQHGGPDSLWPVTFALLQLPTVGELSNAYWQLSGNQYAQLGVSELYSQERFSEDQIACPVRGDGGYMAPAAVEPLKLGGGQDVPGVRPYIDENQCVYARVRYRNLQQDATSPVSGFDEDAIGIMGGAQWAWNGPWYGGVALGYENSDITNTSLLSSDGDRYRVGGSLKYISGGWLVAGAVTGGWSNFDSTRAIAFPGFASVLRSGQDFTDIGGQLRIAYQFGGGGGGLYAKPIVDLNVTNVDMDGFTERGGNGAGLTVAGYNETVFSATPAIEVGTQWGHPGGVLIRPYVRGGVSFYSDADFPITAGFTAASAVAPFTTYGELDDVLGNVSAGITLLSVGGSTLSFGYDGSFGDTIEEHSASAKASMKF